jgi:sugar/nucleoside kinase (ribokinase family)
VIKRGTRGAIAFPQGGPPISQDAFPVNALDTTGAGDNFDAGFVCARMARRGLGDSMKLACACGALSTQALGGVAARVGLQEALALAHGHE